MTHNENIKLSKSLQEMTPKADAKPTQLKLHQIGTRKIINSLITVEKKKKTLKVKLTLKMKRRSEIKKSTII